MIEDIESWLRQKAIPENTIKYIVGIRNSQPARKVRSNGKNVTGFYSSKKMGLTIQFESHTIELAGIIEKEHNRSILEYYDQPPSFNINFQKDGKNRGNIYTADFFVIGEEWIGWEEWKEEDELLRLSIENPNKYSLDKDGKWHFIPGEKFAKELGLSFRVCSSKHLNWTYLRNIRFLEDYLVNENRLKLSNEKIETIQSFVQDNPGINVKNLLEMKGVTFSSDDLYTSIIQDHVYVDLKNEIIPDLTAKIFINKEMGNAYINIQKASNIENVHENPTLIDTRPNSKLLWDGVILTVLNNGIENVTLITEENKPVVIPQNTFEYLIRQNKIRGLKRTESNGSDEFELIKGASEKDLEVANMRYNALMSFLNGDVDNLPVSERQMRTWRSQYQAAERKFGFGLFGLLPNNKNKGNRAERYPERVTEFMQKFILEQYENIKQSSMESVYRVFKQECKDRGWLPPSYFTFTKRVKERPSYEQNRKRRGRKAADQKMEYPYLYMTTPRHGERIFEICHIDHTELDIELVCSQTGQSLGRPWATFLMDAHARRVLAFYLTYDPPSYRSNMMVISECVKRFSRFPSYIVVDGGKDFNSIYFDTLIARNNGKKMKRPPHKPRFGSVLERLFGTTNEMFINNLIGNTQATKNVRAMSREVNPKNVAVWTLESLYKRLEEWLYEVYDQMEHISLGQSPREAFEQSLLYKGNREVTRVVFDRVFKIITLPSTKKGVAKVQPGSGVKINRRYFWSNNFRNGKVENQVVPVKYDPYNMGIAYAYVNKQWIELESEKFCEFNNRTEKEIQLAYDELKARNKKMGIKTDITIKMLVDFLKSIEAEEVLLKQQLKDQAMRNLIVINGGINIDKKNYEEPKNSPKNNDKHLHLVIDNDPVTTSDTELIFEFEDYGEL